MKALNALASDRAGTSALEFAIIAPLFVLSLFTLVAYGVYLSVAHSVQQIAADAARTAVAGLNETERQALVARYVATATDGGLIDHRKITVLASDDPRNGEQFTVSVAYDSSDLPIWKMFTFALPQERIERHSTIRLGGL